MTTTLNDTFRFDWTTVGQSFTEGRQADLVALLETIDEGSRAHAGFDQWLEYVPGLSLPFCQGYAITEAIKQLRLPKVSHVAHTNRFDPYGVVIVRAHYRGPLQVDVVILDRGTDLTPLCMRVLNLSNT